MAWWATGGMRRQSRPRLTPHFCKRNLTTPLSGLLRKGKPRLPKILKSETVRIRLIGITQFFRGYGKSNILILTLEQNKNIKPAQSSGRDGTQRARPYFCSRGRPMKGGIHGTE
jgi:hypothetical protein